MGKCSLTTWRILPGPPDYYQIVSPILLIFAAIIAPELLCPDRRNGVINLYLVRPLSSNDYVLSRWLAFFAVSLVFIYAGQVLLLAGLVMGADDQVEYLRENWAHIPRFLAGGLVIAAVTTTIPLAAAALTTRRAYASLAVIGLFLVSTVTVGILTEVECVTTEESSGDGSSRSVSVSVTFGGGGSGGGPNTVCEPRVRGRWKLGPADRLRRHTDPGQRPDLRQLQRRVGWRRRGASPCPGHRGVVSGRGRRPRVHSVGAVQEVGHVSVQTSTFDRASTGATIEVSEVSKWFGSVVAVNDISLQVSPGVTGLLGPNGAGKTTLLYMIAGLSSCSRGAITVTGEAVRDNPDLYRRVGFMPEHESIYPFLTGRQFVTTSAKLHGITDVAAAADRVIEMVGLEDAQNRSMGGYSRGMRQRMRLAAALVHDPDVIILDEPLNGTDPRQRLDFQDSMERLASEGKTILISSHILEEVETLASRILLMLSGKLAAAGDFRAIRARLDEHAYQVRVVVDRPNAMASAIVEMDSIDSIAFSDDRSLVVHSRNVAELQTSLPRLAQERGIRLTRVEPMDESLESLFEYMVER